MRSLLLVAGFILITGCSSPPISMRYYQLHLPKQIELPINSSELNQILVKPVKVADYLSQGNLVMQINKHELFYSRSDFWAEELSNSFYKSLLQDLNSLGSAQFVSHIDTQVKPVTQSISVELNHFNSTDNSTVIAAGRYAIVPSPHSENKKVKHNTFYFELTLTKDGYAHSVEQLRQLVYLTAQSINTDLNHENKH